MKYCLKCRIELPDTNTVCKLCGGNLTFIGSGGGGACPSCGAEVRTGWRFCKECAYDLQGGPIRHLDSQACSHCGSLIAAGLRFCEACGTPVEVSQGQTLKPEINFRSSSTSVPTRTLESDEQTRVVARPPGPECSECGSEILPGLTGCSVCAATIAEHPQTSRSLQLGLIAAGVLVLLAAGGFAAYYVWYSNSAIEKKLDAAIARGDLFKPEGASAYDLYNQLKNSGVEEKSLSRYKERLIPLLASKPHKMLEDFALPGNKEPELSEWQEALRSMMWASELQPDDNALAARTKYIEGRVGYKNRQKDRALELWKSATDLDKSWPVPPNSVGMIYIDRKDYQASRQYLLEAIRRDPNWAVPYNHLGTSHLFERNDPQAMTYYQQAVERAPNWATPHAWLGDIAMRQNDYALAAEEYQKVLDLAQPGDPTLNLDKIRRQVDFAKKKADEMAGQQIVN